MKFICMHAHGRSMCARVRTRAPAAQLGGYFPDKPLSTHQQQKQQKQLQPQYAPAATCSKNGTYSPFRRTAHLSLTRMRARSRADLQTTFDSFFFSFLYTQNSSTHLCAMYPCTSCGRVSSLSAATAEERRWTSKENTYREKNTAKTLTASLCAAPTTPPHAAT